ncbi:hypothetical protein T484DRAFT_1916924, partial [Baffinella frigidus]
MPTNGGEVGWTIKDGAVFFENVQDWNALECQHHICEIQVHLRSAHQELIGATGLHQRYVELRNK